MKGIKIHASCSKIYFGQLAQKSMLKRGWILKIYPSVLLRVCTQINQLSIQVVFRTQHCYHSVNYAKRRLFKKKKLCKTTTSLSGWLPNNTKWNTTCFCIDNFFVFLNFPHQLFFLYKLAYTLKMFWLFRYSAGPDLFCA